MARNNSSTVAAKSAGHKRGIYIRKQNIRLWKLIKEIGGKGSRENINVHEGVNSSGRSKNNN